MNRYRVTLTPNGRKFGILDTDQYDYCGLPDPDGRMIPLEWEIKEAAEEWLKLCYRRWAAWEGEEKNRRRVPLRWRPQRPTRSPFSQFLTPVHDD